MADNACERGVRQVPECMNVVYQRIQLMQLAPKVPVQISQLGWSPVCLERMCSKCGEFQWEALQGDSEGVPVNVSTEMAIEGVPTLTVNRCVIHGRCRLRIHFHVT